jgi:acyl carrier protein
MEGVKTYFERRQFHLPISFPDRRLRERRVKNIPPLEERRELLKEGKVAILETLHIDPLTVSPREGIKIVLGQIAGMDPSSVQESTQIRSLGLDSFQMVEMLAAIETVYGVTFLDDGAILRVSTVGDLVDLMQEYLYEARS